MGSSHRLRRVGISWHWLCRRGAVFGFWGLFKGLCEFLTKSVTCITPSKKPSVAVVSPFPSSTSTHGGRGCSPPSAQKLPVQSTLWGSPACPPRPPAVPAVPKVPHPDLLARDAEPFCTAAHVPASLGHPLSGANYRRSHSGQDTDLFLEACKEK